MLDYYLKDIGREAESQGSIEKRAYGWQDFKRQAVFGVGGAGAGALVNHLIGNRSTKSYLIGAGIGGLSGILLERLLNYKDQKLSAKQKRGQHIIDTLEANGVSLTEEERDAIIASGGLPDQKVSLLGAMGGTGLDAYLSYKDAKNGTATQTEARRFVEQQAGDGVEKLRTLTDDYMINNPTDERVGRISAMDAELNALNKTETAAKEARAAADKWRHSADFTDDVDAVLRGNDAYNRHMDTANMYAGRKKLTPQQAYILGEARRQAADIRRGVEQTLYNDRLNSITDLTPEQIQRRDRLRIQRNALYDELHESVAARSRNYAMGGPFKGVRQWAYSPTTPPPAGSNILQRARYGTTRAGKFVVRGGRHAALPAAGFLLGEMVDILAHLQKVKAATPHLQKYRELKGE